jgi:polar amino acid transport system substrate-binding protein
MKHRSTHVLAPTGRLRVGLYPGSPASFLGAQGELPERGLGFELGRAFATFLSVPFEPVLFQTNGEILSAVRQELLDLVLVNATPVRAQYLALAEPVLFTDQTYLVGPDCVVRSIGQIDRVGVRIGVSAGSTSEATLPGLLKQATVVSTHGLDQVIHSMQEGELDAFATNKTILSELADRLPGAVILDGAWGTESIALGIPKHREAALDVLKQFSQAAQASGLVEQAIRRAGMRGARL